ncbi:hypothetical protein EV1_019077 [Malus domestica]
MLGLGSAKELVGLAPGRSSGWLTLGLGMYSLVQHGKLGCPRHDLGSALARAGLKPASAGLLQLLQLLGPQLLVQHRGLEYGLDALWHGLWPATAR